MARTPSTLNLKHGSLLPNFSLRDVLSSRDVSSTQLSGGKSGILVMFICNHCPFVKHIWNPLVSLCNEWVGKGLSVVAINSNDFVAYPDDAPDRMEVEAKMRGFEFPYLVDESQSVAKSFDAACTPDFFLFNKNGELVYSGQFDDSRPGNDIPPSGKDLSTAVQKLLSGDQSSTPGKASLGCNIKWKS